MINFFLVVAFVAIVIFVIVVLNAQKKIAQKKKVFICLRKIENKNENHNHWSVLEERFREYVCMANCYKNY